MRDVNPNRNVKVTSRKNYFFIKTTLFFLDNMRTRVYRDRFVSHFPLLYIHRGLWSDDYVCDTPPRYVVFPIILITTSVLLLRLVVLVCSRIRRVQLTP